MRGSAPLSKEGYSLILDIYLGGVSGALVKEGVIENSVHQKLSSPHTPTTSHFLQNIDSIFYKVLDELTPRQPILKTFISIDPPFSYTESNEILFQKNDRTFFETKTKEIFDGLNLPGEYGDILGSHISDGVIIEHPPRNHTLNGYLTSNLNLEGERNATIDQQWIQGNIYNLIQKAKVMYKLGEIVFICNQNSNSDLVFILGDYISYLRVENKSILIKTGVQQILRVHAQRNNLSIPQIESVLKGIDHEHGIKNNVYQNIVSDISQSVSRALKESSFSDYKYFACTYVGDSFMFPVIKDAFSIYNNVSFVEIHKGINARLLYIEKNNVQ